MRDMPDDRRDKTPTTERATDKRADRAERPDAPPKAERTDREPDREKR